MTAPARRSQKQQVYQAQKHAVWWLLGLTALAAAIEMLMNGGVGSWVITKSVALGAVLNFVAHGTFTWVAYRTTGAKARQQVMLNMYLGQMLKWLITLAGFALIFIYAKPIHAALVAAAYFVMQLCCLVGLMKVR